MSTPLPVRLHIGHHFFGAGNLGDDLMLAGFLEALARQGRAVELTCCIPFDPASQRRRFPHVTWLPYDDESRRGAIRQCDAWVGLGGTPFQVVVGPWFLEHLAEELEACRQFGKPMHFLGVGVNEAEALDDLRARQVLDYAGRVWVRDVLSGEMLQRHCDPRRVAFAADLSHVYLRALRDRLPPVDAEAVGYVLNFEDPGHFDAAALCSLVQAQPQASHRWLAQEVRRLEGSELALLETLPPECRQRLEVRVPDYAAATTEELAMAWRAPGRLVTSRYHAAILGAWTGARVVAVERSEKIRGLVRQMGMASVPALTDADRVRRALDAATAVPLETLDRLAEGAESACRQLLLERPSPSTGARLALADVQQVQARPFTSFMAMMNAFAAPLGLRTFTNWSKIWEYPWLWHEALARVDWRGKRLVDLGSEISPMPWFLATLGARVTLVEADPQWHPTWQRLRDVLNVDVDWHIVQFEAVPLADGSADVVTSFSVIEHQPNKSAAVDEVARVLRPGGTFALSFDVCEPDMGMTFPEWNGRAMTMREFEDVVWNHPAFSPGTAPSWNTESIVPFLDWHRTTAPHHNYVVAAAVLRRG